MTTTTRSTTALALPAQPISEEVLLEKYAKGDERSVDDVRRARRARARRRPRRRTQRAHWEARFLRGAAQRLHAGRPHPLGRRHRARRPR